MPDKMIATVRIENDTVFVTINDPKVDGQKSIFEVLIDANPPIAEIERIIFDFDVVSFINSLGIAEFISIIRFFTEKNKKLKFKFVNVDKKIIKIFKMIELSNIADIEAR